MKLLHQDTSPRTLGIVRGWVFGLWLIKIAAEPLQLIADLPPSIIQSVGFLQLLPMSVLEWLHGAAFLYWFKCVTIVCLACVLFKVFTKPAMLIGCVLLTIYQAIIRGPGFNSHNELALLYAAYCLALFAVADALVHRTDEHRAPVLSNLNSMTLNAMLLCLCLAYHFVGVYRLTHGGLEVFTSDSLTYWMVHNGYRYSSDALALGQYLLDYPGLQLMLKVAFPISTVFEILAPLCLVSGRFRSAFLIVMIPFHLFNWLTMDILFWENYALFVLLFDINRLVLPRRAVQAAVAG